MTALPVLLALIAQPTGKPFLRYPDVHGDQVVFSCEGDLWLGDLKSGHADRITSDAGLEDFPAFSPDGTMIAFNGEYDGIRGAYVMPTTGGAPKRITYAMNYRAVTGWTPDGKSVVFRKAGTPTSYEYWTAPIGKGVFERIPLEFASHVWFGPDRDTYCFTRFARWYSAWFYYIGGMANQVWVHKDGKFTQITNVDGTNEYPVWCGERIYFANERDGHWTLMSVSPSGGKVKTEAGPYDVEVRELSTDGHRVIYEKGRDVELFDPATSKAATVSFDLQSDLIHTRTYQVDSQDYMAAASLSPTAKRVLVETRGQIVSLPVGEGEARLWKAQAGVRFQLPEMSPDAKKVAYVCDQSGEQQIWISDADGSNAKALTTGQRQIKSLKWSPDAKWIVYYDSRMRLGVVNVATGEDKEMAHLTADWTGPAPSFSPDSKWVTFSESIEHTTVSAIQLYELETGRKIQVSDGTADDTASAFSTDGKWLAFLSGRVLSASHDPILNQLDFARPVTAYVIPLQADTKSPFTISDPVEGEAKPAEEKKDAPFKIDLEGLYGRRIAVPVEPDAYQQIVMVKDRILLGSGRQITFYDLSGKKGGTLTAGGIMDVSKDGSKLLIGGRRTLRVVDSNGADLPPTAGTVSFGGLKLEIQPVAEWHQIYWDAWRLLRDYFYIPNMNGADWQAVGAKYAAMLPSVRSRSELDELIRWLQGELGSSHQYLMPGDIRNIKPKVPPAFLGIDLVADGDHLKIAHIVRGDGFQPSERSPLADPQFGFKDGEYLLKVGGEDVSSEIQVYDLLLGRAGQVVSVTVNDKASLDGAKTVFVKPVADDSRMRYVEWVANNRAYVDKASGGRVGYLHLAAMGDNDMEDFAKQYFPQRNKEALIIDDRYNNGGYIQNFINTILSEKVTGYFNMRNSREPWGRQSDAFIGPKCCLINEFSISCGEEFPHRFQDLKIGPLIGRRTMGGEVGSSPGWPLADGGEVDVPDYGMFVPGKGWVIEGAGVSPDIDVPSDPNAWVEGRDPQLDVAVKTMLDTLKKNPVVWPQQPPDRVRIKK